MRPRRASCVGAVALAAAVGGCGGSGGSANASAHCANPIQSGKATLVIDGSTAVSTTGNSCPYSFSISGNPRFNYSGPTGCKGRYFFTEYQGSIDFHYSARDAYLVWAQTIYHFINGPRRRAGQLVFDQIFGDHHIIVKIDCPPPALSGPLLPANY